MNEIHEIIRKAAAENGLEVADYESIRHHYLGPASSFMAWQKTGMELDMERVAAYCKAYGKPLVFTKESIGESFSALVLWTREYKPTPRELAIEFVEQGALGDTTFPSQLSPFITIDYDAIGKYIMEHYKVSGEFVFE